MTARVPAETFPPGEFIQDFLDDRGWSQADLADVLGRPVQAISEIMNAKKAITPETARGLGDAFGTGPEFWLNLETAYRLSLARPSDDVVARRAALYSKAPIRDLIRRKWIKDTDNPDILEAEVLRLLHLDSIESGPQYQFAAKQSTSYGMITSAHIAWYHRARELATQCEASRFTQEAFLDCIGELRACAANVADIRKVPGILASAGVRYVIVEHLPKTKVDGAAFWLNETSPVIVMSLRFDRIDNFWHVLGHELAHIKNEDKGNFVDNDLMDRPQDEEKPEFEIRADRMAATLLIPTARLEGFINLYRPRFSKLKIQQFAKDLRIHPGIVVGQLQFARAINYSHSREMLVPVRDSLIDVALTDGWGRTPA